MFYVSHNPEEDEDHSEGHVNEENNDLMLVTGEMKCTGQTGESEVKNVPNLNLTKVGGGNRIPSGKKKSCTLKSSTSSLGGSYDTPPESPPIRKSGEEGSDSSETEEEASSKPEKDVFLLAAKPPVPPPRNKRKKLASAKLELLKISDPQVQLAGDMLMAGYGGREDQSQREENTNLIRGHLSMLVISAKGLRQMKKVRWFVLDKKCGRLRYFRNEEESELLGEIDIQSATFRYDVQTDRNGEFTVW